MKKNMGLYDRGTRLLLGGVLMVGAYYYYEISSVAALIIGAVGATLLTTGLIGWCGLYTLLGWSTVEKTGKN